MKKTVFLCFMFTGFIHQLGKYSVEGQVSTADTGSNNVTLKSDAQTDSFDSFVGNEVTFTNDAIVANNVTVSYGPNEDDDVNISRYVSKGNDVTQGTGEVANNVSVASGGTVGDDVVTGSSVNSTDATPDEKGVSIGSQNVNYAGGGFSEGSDERLEQVEVLKTCFKMEWSGMDFFSNLIQINVTNNKTQEKVTFSVDSRDSTLMVCDLQEHQSYKVQLSDPGWQSGRVIEKFMWTKHVTPPYPPFPEVEYTTEKSIGLKIFAVDFDLNKGPFSGFNVRIMKSKSLNEVGKQRTEGRYIVGVPLGYSVTVLSTNTDQQFVIGETNEGSNFKLTKDTEYEIYVGTVSTVAHITTHAYVSDTQI